MNKDLLYLVAISLLKNVGPVFGRTLINHFDTLPAIFSASKKDLSNIPSIGKSKASSLYEQISTEEFLTQAQDVIDQAKKENVQILCYKDQDYPTRIANIKSAPLILYYKGNASLNHFRNVGIVGARKATERGKIQTEKIIDDLVSFNIHTISGLAYGIDGTCHKHSLATYTPTIAVVGHGLDMIYPKEHEKLAKKIVDNGGILSEYVFGKGPEAMHFPMRNRLVTALSDALVVIESKETGGSMITADLGHQHKKHVFALPGRLSDPYSAGCNKLIKTHKALLLQSGKDISNILRWDADKNTGVQKQLFVDLDDTEKEILTIIGHKDARSLDQIHIQSKIALGELAGILIGLEFKGIIKSIPGSRYISC